MSSSPSQLRPSAMAHEHAQLRRAVGRVARLLPAQGPLSVFIHHNPLHAFEDLPFEAAVVEAGRVLGCEPYLDEDRYRAELERGRIHAADLDAVVTAELGPRAADPVLGDITRHELWRRVLVHGIPKAQGTALAWILAETAALRQFRDDLPAEVRELVGSGVHPVQQRERTGRVEELWDACRRAAARSGFAPPPPPSHPLRHRDLLLAAAAIDVDELVHPLLIRATSAFLDQGLADWPMPERGRGFYPCVLSLYGSRLGRLCGRFGAELGRAFREEADAGGDAWSSLDASLRALGVPPEEHEAFLAAEALALRGFAGMVHQLEVRPDRVPAQGLPARLVDFLAIRLLILRAALLHATRRVAFRGPLSDLRRWLLAHRPTLPESGVDDLAWPLFHVAQLFGVDAPAVDDLEAPAVARLQEELADLDSTVRRRLFHRAYERHLRHRFFDALVEHGSRSPEAPLFQAIFCIDEREESMRRHLEEVDPRVETFGVAGFFGVAMYYRSAADAHPRPLCPVAIRPRHFVAEVDEAGAGSLAARLRRVWIGFGALVDKNVHLGGRLAGHGAVLMATLGVLWVVPLVLRVLFPWLGTGTSRLLSAASDGSTRRLVVEQRSDSPDPPVGEQAGFTIEEMAAIVRDVLLPTGITRRWAPLVLVLGHGSTSLNNPHESAHDCGACGGGRGGNNARAFAVMANHPSVRALLQARGLTIPEGTWFVGGQRDTANNDVRLFDEDRPPAAVRAVLEDARRILDEARRREAHERCRRFESAPLWLPPFAALLHVQARAADLAQPRPEYGHATNAVCFVGRRSRTRGLFLDRRAFLVSFDPSTDPDGVLLEGLLGAVVPVVAGINLEYLFGYVDPVGYGCGTKLPHNITSLVGVMDGAQSDLRTGLPWQMLEVHEPVRLCLVVEAAEDLVARIVDANPQLRRLVHNAWIQLAVLDPGGGRLRTFDGSGGQMYEPERRLRVVHGTSRVHYHERREHLPFVALDGGEGATP